MSGASFTGENVFQLVVYLAIFVGVLFLTYYITKWIANNQKVKLSARNFEVIETSKVSSNKFLQIVRIGRDDYYIIAIGKEEVKLIGKLDKEQIVFQENIVDDSRFKNLLGNFQSQLRKGDKTKEDKNGHLDE